MLREGALLFVPVLALTGCAAASNQALETLPATPQETVFGAAETPAWVQDIRGHNHFANNWSKMDEWTEADKTEAIALIKSWRTPEAKAAAVASVQTTWSGWTYAETDLEWVLSSGAQICQQT